MKKPITKKERLRTFALSALVATSFTAGVRGQAIFRETFEELTLGPNVEEVLAGSKVWTKTGPVGWIADDSKVPGVGDPALNGITEWAGWSFADKKWWVSAAGDQRRSEFVYGQGNVMIADPDEWDDATHTPGLLETAITTKSTGLTNVAASTLVLVYDSSWRPEAKDDGAPNFPVDAEGNRINDQTGVISISFDGAAPSEIQRWTSVSEDPTYHDHFPNEAVIIPLSNPAGATNFNLRIAMEKAANDWWWAVDNITVGTPPLAYGISANGVSFTVRIAEALGKSVDQSKGVVLELDGTAVAPVTLAKEGDLVLATYSQAPLVFSPGSRHTVKVKYTSNEAKALEDTLEFIAPTYVSLATTPVSLSATLTEAEWLTVDETKGVKFTLDGAPVTPSSVTRAETVITARSTQTPPFASNSAHTLVVTYTTASGQQIDESVPFTAPTYPTIAASLGTALGTAAQPGMRWRTHQLATARGTTIAETEAQLAGTAGASIHDTTGQGTDGYFPIDFVNFDQVAGDAGNFTSSAEAPQDVADLAIPGIPVDAANDNIAGEALTFVEFPQTGIYTMVVNSDDGFQLSAGTTNNPTQVVLGKFDGGRGAADSQVFFKVDQVGVYLFRLLWFEGGSDARVEWFTLNTDGSRALVGGTQTGSLKAYRARTVAEPGGGGGTGGIISFTGTGNNLTINYDGTLSSSTNVAGPFQPLTGAAKPYITNFGDKSRFYIAK